MRLPWFGSSCAPVLLGLVAATALANCPPPYTGSGHATYYVPSAGSACSVANVDGETTAITSVRWIGSAHCGECLRVQGPLGSAIVKVTDECPDCTASDLDLTQAAFAKIGNLADGIINISWQRVDCPVAGGLKLQVQDGVNPYYFSGRHRSQHQTKPGFKLGIVGQALLRLFQYRLVERIGVSAFSPTDFRVGRSAADRGRDSEFRGRHYLCDIRSIHALR
jgi:hypothetical protein